MARKQSEATRAIAVLDAWWRERVHNSPVSRAPQAYEHLHSVFGELKDRLKAEFEPTKEEKEDVT